MSEDYNISGYILNSNIDIQLHEQGELEHMVKKKIIPRNLLDYNRKLGEYLKEAKGSVKDEEGFKQRLKKLQKELGKMDQLNEIDRIAILNNKFANESELILKVQNCANISSKERKTILQLQLSQ